MGFKGSKVQILSSRPYIRKMEEGGSQSAVFLFFVSIAFLKRKKTGKAGHCFPSKKYFGKKLPDFVNDCSIGKKYDRTTHVHKTSEESVPFLTEGGYCESR